MKTANLRVLVGPKPSRQTPKASSLVVSAAARFSIVSCAVLLSSILTPPLIAATSVFPPPTTPTAGSVPIQIKKIAGNDTNIVPIKASFYDQPIGGISGEFGARVPGACGYNTAAKGPTNKSFWVTPNMVADTLSYSKELHKKIPRKGAWECNSANIEKWFDPAYASGLACQELPFKRMIDSAGIERLRIKDTMFFPIDSLAPPGQLEGPKAQFEADPKLGPGFSGVADLTYPPWYSGLHNFNWCMEINGQFKYRGGETFAFEGDDDVWIYLDNKLARDIGGIHGSAHGYVYKDSILAIDTLPYIKGRIGETFDFDLYFCERRPAGSDFYMRTSMDIKPVLFQDVEITDTAGKSLDPAAPFTGKQRLCAMPIIAQSFCGNSADRPPGKFYPATWTLNGTVIAKDSCIDLDPNELPFNKRITLAAKAEGKTAKLNLQVLKANMPEAIVLKGNGRLESIEIPLDSRSDSLEAPVRVDYPFAGTRHSDSAFSGSFIQSSHRLSLALPPERQGPAAHSATDTGKGLYTQTVLGYPLQLVLPIRDSITPIIRTAAWKSSPRIGELRLDLVPSEPMANAFPAKIPLLFKGRRGNTWRVDLVNGLTIANPGVCDTFRVAANPLPFSPKDADSVSFSEAAMDAVGNAARPSFSPLSPVGWTSDAAEITSIGLEGNPIKGDGTTPIISPVSLVLLDKQGNAYNTSGDNPRLAQAAGPVIGIRSAERLDRLEIEVYSNLGIPVDRGNYTFSDTEWERMVAEAGSDTASARVLWYPSSGGAMLGTGAYILKGSITTKRSYSQDGSGQWHEKSPTRKYFGPLLFGYLRQ